MKRFRFVLQCAAAAIALLLAPWLLLKAFGLGIPKAVTASVVLGTRLIPAEVALFLIYFNTALVTAFAKGARCRSVLSMGQTILMLLVGDLLLGYTLVVAIRAMWLR